MFYRRQKGYLILILILLMVVVGAVGASLARILTRKVSSANDLQQAERSFYIASGALERGIYALLTPHLTLTGANTKRYACSAITFANQPLGTGEYTLTNTPEAGHTVLSAALTSSATLIPVASIAGLATTGRVMIDKETIDYDGVSTTSCGGEPACLLQAARGTDASTAIAHAISTPVAQYQCALNAEGAAPTLANPQGKRVVAFSAQRQKAWTVGDQDDLNEYFIMVWDGSGWTRDTALPINDHNLYGISMLSYADGWAVGKNRRFLHWDGTQWTDGPVATGGADKVPNRDVINVDCVSKNECYAVGDHNADYNVAAWDGTQWKNDPVNATKPSGVHGTYGIKCIGSQNCWAVGDDKSILRRNATEWSDTGFTVNANVPDTRYHDIDCPSSTQCFAVGDANAANLAIIGWQSGTNEWSRDSISASNANQNLNGITCAESNDCWAVGTGKTFVHWDGSTWTISTAVTTIPNVAYNAVACYHQDDCWAVGDPDAGQPTWVHWDGTNWTRFAAAGLPDKPLRGIAVVGPRHFSSAGYWKEIF